MTFYKIKAKGNKAAEINIYGDIGESWWGESVTAKQFVKDLAALDVDNLTVRINSIGGSVSDGIAIYNAIKRHKAATTVAIDSMALSIASLIAMAGDTVEMADNALMMIHAPWTYASGNSVDMREAADVLDKFAEAMSSSYAQKTGKTTEAVMSWLTDGVDHWFTAAEARAEGLIDTITGALPIAASFDLSRFNNVPAAAGIFNKPPTKENIMPTPVATQPAATEKPTAIHPAPQPEAALTPEQITAQVQAKETERRQAIRSRFTPLMNKFPSAGLDVIMNAALDDMSMTVEAAVDRAMIKMGEGHEPIAGNFHHRVETVETEQAKFKTGVIAALSLKAGMLSRDLAAKERNNEFKSMTLLELARAALRINNVSTSGMSKLEVVAAAFTHTSSDFANLLANVAEKSMLMGYDEAEETFQLWTRPGTASDFKPIKRVDLNSFPSLELVPEGGEYKYGTVGDRGETVQLATYGKLFSITRQAIINDDLNAFTSIPRRQGRAAIRTVGNLVYAVLTSNPNMSDGVALFHATHNNLLTGSAPNTTSVDAMRVAMAKQKDGGENAHALNIRLAHLLVPMALEGTAKVVAESEFEVGAATRNNTTPNSVRGTFDVISDARLDAASASVWYGAANAGQHDTVEVTYLDGQDQPYLEAQNGWDVDGAEFKVRIDAAVSPLDFRTMAKNPGA